MIAAEPAFTRHIQRYEQHHALEPPPGAGSADDTEFDGLVLQWFDSYEGFLGFLHRHRVDLRIAGGYRIS